MKIAIIAQEEPVYFGPFIRKIISEKSCDIVCVCILGNRGIGSHPKTFLEKMKNIYSLWLLFEPSGFFKSLFIQCRQKLLSCLNLIGSKYDTRSIYGIAKEKQLPIINTNDINAPNFLKELKRYSPDVILNQSEMIIKNELLLLPKIGIMNRHASLLPKFRGRVGSFWSHADVQPEYGVTIHLVNKDIDSGPIITQKQFDIDSKLSYPKILDLLFAKSIPLTLHAFNSLDDPSFSCTPNEYKNTKTYVFPALNEIKNYRKILRNRRK